MSTTVEQEIRIDAPIEVVWRTVTEPRLISQWFAEDVDLVAAPGNQGSMTFRATDQHPEHHTNVTVQTVEPPHKFSYRWEYPAGASAAPGNSTLVEFTLAADGDGTRLRVVETGLDELDWTAQQKREFCDGHNDGWTNFLGCIGGVVREHAQ